MNYCSLKIKSSTTIRSGTMLKQFFLGLCILVFWGALAIAQENPESNANEMKVIKKDALAWNKVCPVDGKSVNQDIANIEFDKRNYGFCSQKCSESFKSNPKLYAKNLSEDGTKFINNKENKSY
jgi:YHS domain-containing protein